MHVAVDTSARYTTRAGIARYVNGLLRGLHASGARVPDEAWHFSEFAWPVENFDYRQPGRAFRTLYREHVWSRLVAPGQLRRLGAELLHTTGLVLHVPRPPIRHVVTLHDLAILRHPERFRRWTRQAFRRSFAQLARADQVLCISRHTADEAIRLLALDPARLTVVHNGCDFVGAPAEEARPTFGVPHEFFLFVGSLEPGKNLALLKSAWQEARNAWKDLPPLLIVGARWPGVTAEGPPPADWQYLGHVPDPCLVWLYRHAVALLFPSKYEGFGLPVAEAMALGCPVVCSPMASIPEVAGDAALMVDPSPAAYLDAMNRLIREPGLRRDLAERGLRQSARFSWERCATDTLEVYRQAARGT